MTTTKCTVCADPRCSSIDRELQSGQSCGTVAERFRLAKTTVWRHAKRCIRDVMASADAARDAAFDDLVSALNRQTKCLRKMLSGPERFKLQRWQEWTKANTQLERLIALKTKAFRRSSTVPSEQTSEQVLSPNQLESEMIGLLKEPATVEWLRLLLVKVGRRDLAVPDVRLISTASLTDQLVADRENRERVRTCLLEAEAICLAPMQSSYVVHGSGDGNAREGEMDTFGTSSDFNQS